MKISVIIPTNRKEKLLDFELPSFSRQTFPKEDFEIIIVDDSPDDRKELVENFGRIHNLNIKWMRSKKPYYRINAKIGCARNTGLIHAQGELIIFIDDYSFVRQNYLESVWNVYKRNTGVSLVGPVISIEYADPPYPENIDDLKIRSEDMRVRTIFPPYGQREQVPKTCYKEHRIEAIPCSSNWFYTSNASAPLRELIKVNGFWEMADLTREEDILLGLALVRNGWKFCFLNAPEVSVYHMVHDYRELSVNKRFKDVSYEQLGWDTVEIDGRMVEGGGGKGTCGLDTKQDEIQLVTKDIFNTKYPGSWALIEYFNNHPEYIFNKETGFDLREERKKAGNWI